MTRKRVPRVQPGLMPSDVCHPRRTVAVFRGYARGRGFPAEAIGTSWVWPAVYKARSLTASFRRVPVRYYSDAREPEWHTGGHAVHSGRDSRALSR